MDLEYDPATLQHDWLLVVLIPVTSREVTMLDRGQRVVFKKIDVNDAGQVRGSALKCGRCQLAWVDMSPEERERCRGDDDDDEPGTV